MADPLKLAIHGGAGRVGRLLVDLALADPRFELAAVLVRPDSPLAGSAAHARSPLPFTTEWPETVDVVVDFSLPAALPGVLEQVRRRPGCALVCGTTGLDLGAVAALDELAMQRPMLWASNFALGAAVLTELARLARALLPAEFEGAIFEAHHSSKLDAPSGTALTLADAMAEAGARPQCSSLRAGPIVGEHTVWLAGPAERLELCHRATDRSLFARGALAAAAWLHGRAPGRYHVRDLLLRA